MRKYRRTNKRIYKKSKTEIIEEVNLSMKTVIKGYKYRIYPTEKQKELINKTFGCSRFIYWIGYTK